MTKKCHSFFFRINGVTEVASLEIRQNSKKFEKQFSAIPSYFLQLVTSIVTSFFINDISLATSFKEILSYRLRVNEIVSFLLCYFIKFFLIVTALYFYLE